MFEWTEYAINLAKQLGLENVKTYKEKKIGRDLEVESLDKFRDEQVAQLHELYKTAKGLDEEEKQNK
jgi:hypothetical protein